MLLFSSADSFTPPLPSISPSFLSLPPSLPSVYYVTKTSTETIAAVWMLFSSVSFSLYPLLFLPHYHHLYTTPTKPAPTSPSPYGCSSPLFPSLSPPIPHHLSLTTPPKTAPTSSNIPLSSKTTSPAASHRYRETPKG